MAKAAVRSKAVVLLFFNHFYFCPNCLCGLFVGPCFVIQYFMSFLCCNHLYGEESAGSITFKMKLSLI